MIVGNKKDFSRYKELNEAFRCAFSFLESLSEDSTKASIDENGVRGGISVIAKSDTFAEGEPKCFEAHRRDIDIHYVLQGEERFGYAHVDTLCPKTAYNEENDYILLTGGCAAFVTLRTGDFCIVFPEDAHIPCLASGNTDKVKKVILKIRDK